MDVKMRVTQSANAVHLNVSVRLPYDDLWAAGQALLRLFARPWERVRR